MFNRKSVPFRVRAILVVAGALIALVPGAARALSASTSHTFAVEADTYVSPAPPPKPNGDATTLKVDNTPHNAYLRFTVSGLSNPVAKATLRVYSTKSNDSGVEVHGVAANNWDEATMMYADAPAVTGTATATSGALPNDDWVSLDVTSLVNGNGTYSFALTSASAQTLTFASRERDPSTAPQLVVDEAAAATDTTAPSAPTNLVKSSATTSSIGLSWSASTDNVGVTGYRVYRDATLLGSTAQTSFTAGGLSCGTSYTFQVEAYDAAGNKSPQTPLTAATSGCADSQAPSAPSGLGIVGQTASSIWISWTASTDNVGVAGYDLYNGTTSVGTTSGTTYTFNGLACGTNYTLGVVARDAAGNTSSRSTIAASTSACGTTAKTYYVDSAGGSDLAAGTSQSTAWQSLAKVNSAPLVAGDTVLFKRGGVWSGSLKITASGTSSSAITIDAYGTGNLPVIGGGGASSCVVLSGSYLVMRNIQADNCSWAGVQVTGSQDTVANSLITHNAAGVHVDSGASGTQVQNNNIVDNNKMSVLTQTPTNDDSGAFGVLLNGDNSNVGWNTISGSDAFSYDYGRDGAAVEVYGGQGNYVHDNTATDNHDFTELGNSRSADNTFAYNLVRSSLDTSTFLITRGGSSSLGPVLRTHAYNNTAYLTGASSQGFVCYDGCSSSVLTMRNNIVQAVQKVGYADAAFDENDDVFYGGQLQFTKGANSVVANPGFAAAGSADFHLQASSTAVDRGVGLGYATDLDQHPVPTDGNGDGIAAPDAGVYERPAATQASDTTPPSAPGAPMAGATTGTSIALSWTASTDNVGVSGYRVFQNGTLLTSTGQTSYTATGLTCGTSYTFGVEAYDAAGNTSSRTTATLATGKCADTSAPTIPSNLTPSTVTATSITLSWTASMDNVGVSGYGVYRNGTSVGSTALTVYTFSGLTCGTSYVLAVDAYDAAGNRSAKSSVTTSTSPCVDGVPPSTPANFTQTGGDASSLSVSWSASTDNVAVTGYNVYLNGAKVGTTTTTTSYKYTGLTCATGYTLGVEAFDAAGNVSGRASLTAATSACSSPSPPPSSSGPCGTTSTPPTSWQHVVWVVMENKQYGQIIGSSNAPYINSLAKACASATSMYAESHPSLPNYIAMTSGSTQGITDDSGPSSHPLNVASIFSQLGSGGWKSLEEDMPSNCYMGNSGNYAVRHNPATYYTNITSQCAAQDVPLGSTPDISARFTFVTPNTCNDMHSCPTQSDITTEVKTGDTWLSTFIPKLTSSTQYKAGNTVIFLTWDEDDYSSANGNHIATLVISPSTPAGLTVSTRFDHYSMLRTTEDLLGLSAIGSAASASSMATAFHLR